MASFVILISKLIHMIKEINEEEVSMKRNLKKSLVAMSLALTLCIGSASTAHAAGICPHPSGVHDFSDCRTTGGHYNSLGYHEYLWGYDHNHAPIYHNDCELRQAIRECMYVCHHCGAEEPGGAHEHPEGVTHSISHQ